jgi:hypothetical protein
MRANALEGIGKELKIKRKSYVSSRDVKIVCPPALGEWYRTFRRIVLPIPPRAQHFKKNLGLFDHKKSTNIRNVESHSPNDAAPHSVRPMATTPL